jgi:hypothetical protein
MKVKIGTEQHDAEKEPIALIFKDDKERLGVISHLQNMQPKEGERIYLMYPDGQMTEKDINIFLGFDKEKVVSAKFPLGSIVLINKNIVGVVLSSYNMFTPPSEPNFIYRIIVDAKELCHRVRNNKINQAEEENLFIEDLDNLLDNTEQIQVIEAPEYELSKFEMK